jgi:hypothetical protein
MYTVKEFCELLRISPRYWALLRAQGRGPTITRVNGRIVISADAITEWLKSQERAA